MVPIIAFKFFIQFLPIFVRGNWCEYLKAIPFLNTFEISATTSPPPGATPCVPPFEQLAERGVDCL
jgi:hypothetical protein